MQTFRFIASVVLSAISGVVGMILLFAAYGCLVILLALKFHVMLPDPTAAWQYPAYAFSFAMFYWVFYFKLFTPDMASTR